MLVSLQTLLRWEDNNPRLVFGILQIACSDAVPDHTPREQMRQLFHPSIWQVGSNVWQVTLLYEVWSAQLSQPVFVLLFIDMLLVWMSPLDLTTAGHPESFGYSLHSPTLGHECMLKSSSWLLDSFKCVIA